MSNALLQIAAHTLVEHCDDLPDAEVAAACDDALRFVGSQGSSHAVLRKFPRAVARVLQTHGRTTHADLATPSGQAGPLRQTLLASLERLLGKKVDLSERADRGLLGGASLSVGDERLEASLRGALRQLRSHLARSAAASPLNIPPSSP